MTNKFPYFSFLVLLALTLSISVLPMQSSQASDEMLVSLTLPNNTKKPMRLSINQPLSELRNELTKRGNISKDDKFVIPEMGELSPRDEAAFKVSDALLNGKALSFKLRVSTLMNEPKKEANAGQYKKQAEGKISATSLALEGSLPEEKSVAPTANIVSYSSLSEENRNFIFNSLKLKSAINLDLNEARVRTSFRTGVIWTKHPDFNPPHRDLEVKRSYSLSKTYHEISKSSVANVKAKGNYLGLSFDTEYEYNSQALERKQSTDIYLLATYNVQKIELSINKRFIRASPELEEEIREVMDRQNQDIILYQDLIKIFDEYGFCVPTKFVLGGQIYCEDKKKVQSKDEADKASHMFAASVEASFVGGSFGAGGGYANATTNIKSEGSVQHTVTKLVTGGDIGLANDPVQWMRSLNPTQEWRVIERGDFLSNSRCKKRCSV